MFYRDRFVGRGSVTLASLGHDVRNSRDRGHHSRDPIRQLAFLRGQVDDVGLSLISESKVGTGSGDTRTLRFRPRTGLFVQFTWLEDGGGVGPSKEMKSNAASGCGIEGSESAPLAKRIGLSRKFDIAFLLGFCRLPNSCRLCFFCFAMLAFLDAFLLGLGAKLTLTFCFFFARP